MTPRVLPFQPKGRRFETQFGALGGEFLDLAAAVGGMGVLFVRLLLRLIPPRLDYRELKRNLYKMAVLSLPLVYVTALFTGAIVCIQTAPTVRRLGAEGQIGWAAGLGTLREIAPLLTAMMLSGRIGANNAAELGTMTITEQVDALRTLAIDPLSFLVLPRFLAVTLTLFIMTLYADVCAIAGAAVCAKVLLGVDIVSSYNGFRNGLIVVSDLTNGLVKSLVFGAIIGLTSCYFGLSTQGGAPGVGRSVQATVVASAVGVFFFDYIFGFLLG